MWKQVRSNIPAVLLLTPPPWLVVADAQVYRGGVGIRAQVVFKFLGVPDLNMDEVLVTGPACCLMGGRGGCQKKKDSPLQS